VIIIIVSPATAFPDRSVEAFIGTISSAFRSDLVVRRRTTCHYLQRLVGPFHVTTERASSIPPSELLSEPGKCPTLPAVALVLLLLLLLLVVVVVVVVLLRLWRVPSTALATAVFVTAPVS